MSPSSCLLFTIASFLFLSSLATSERIDCAIPPIFEVEIEDNKRIFVYDAEISVKYNRNELAVYEYEDTNQVNILINNSAIFFSGHVLQNEDFNPNTLKTSRVLDTKIAGSAQLMRNINSGGGGDEVTDCNTYLARRKNDDWDLSKNIQTEILHQAAVCLKSAICKKLGHINLNDLKNAASHPYDFGQLSVLSKRLDRAATENFNVEDIASNSKQFDPDNLTALMSTIDQMESNDVDKDGLQSTINVIVDIAIAEIVKEMKKENNGTIKIPDIKQRFSDFLLKLTGEFDAYDGSFSDITTLTRIGDASLSRAGQKFSASCGFGLSKATIHYERYKLIYGLKVTGKISADVKGVSVYVTVAVDYSEKPCQIELQELQVIELGKIKIRVTGLGPLNGLTSQLVSWITDKWRNDIVLEVEKQVRAGVEDYMHKLDCEKFRP